MLIIIMIKILSQIYKSISKISNNKKEKEKKKINNYGNKNKNNYKKINN